MVFKKIQNDDQASCQPLSTSTFYAMTLVVEAICCSPDSHCFLPCQKETGSSNKSYGQGLRGGQQLDSVCVPVVDCVVVSSVIVVICLSLPSYMACQLGCDLRLTKGTTITEMESETEGVGKGERGTKGEAKVQTLVCSAKHAVGC